MNRTQTIHDGDAHPSAPALRLAQWQPVQSPSHLGQSRIEPPMVLHTRVVTGSGGGPEKTILRSAAYADANAIRMAAAYMHPQGDDGIAVIRAHARQWHCPLYEIAETGALDVRTVRSMLQVCRKLRVAVWHGHDYKSNALGLLLRRLWPMKLVTTVHGWTRQTMRTRLYYHVDNACLSRYDQVITVSPRLYKHCKAHGVPADRLTYIPNAIEPDEFKRSNDRDTARTHLGVSRSALVIGVVGRFSPEKGIDRAVHAVAALRRLNPDVQLHLLGDGPGYERLQALARKLRVTEAVHFWGWQPSMQRFYEMMDLLLIPSHTEGLPNVALEAMSMRVPVAATDVGGVRQLLKNGRRGVILSQDHTTWARDLGPLLADPQRRAELAVKGRQRIKKYYTFQQRMQHVLSVYDRVLKIARPGRPHELRRAA